MRYDLVYHTGGSCGPYKTVESAVRDAYRRMVGCPSERAIYVVQDLGPSETFAFPDLYRRSVAVFTREDIIATEDAKGSPFQSLRRGLDLISPYRVSDHLDGTTGAGSGGFAVDCKGVPVAIAYQMAQLREWSHPGIMTTSDGPDAIRPGAFGPDQESRWEFAF